MITQLGSTTYVDLGCGGLKAITSGYGIKVLIKFDTRTLPSPTRNYGNDGIAETYN